MKKCLLAFFMVISLVCFIGCDSAVNEEKVTNWYLNASWAWGETIQFTQSSSDSTTYYLQLEGFKNLDYQFMISETEDLSDGNYWLSTKNNGIDSPLVFDSNSPTGYNAKFRALKEEYLFMIDSSGSYPTVTITPIIDSTDAMPPSFDDVIKTLKIHCKTEEISFVEDGTYDSARNALTFNVKAKKTSCSFYFSGFSGILKGVNLTFNSVDKTLLFDEGDVCVLSGLTVGETYSIVVLVPLQTIGGVQYLDPDGEYKIKAYVMK